MSLDELEQEELDIIHELVLRGLAETNPTEREYGRAYDSFVEAAGYPLQIGDQPERVQDAWERVAMEPPTTEEVGLILLDEAGAQIGNRRRQDCSQCNDPITTDIMVPAGEGPMHPDCWMEWVKDQ